MERRAENYERQFVSLRDEHNELVAMTQFRIGAGKRVSIYGGYTLVVKKHLVVLLFLRPVRWWLAMPTKGK